MRNIKFSLLWLLIGMMIGAPMAIAVDNYIRLQSSDGLAITSTNPLPIQSY